MYALVFCLHQVFHIHSYCRYVRIQIAKSMCTYSPDSTISVDDKCTFWSRSAQPPTAEGNVHFQFSNIGRGDVILIPGNNVRTETLRKQGELKAYFETYFPWISETYCRGLLYSHPIYSLFAHKDSPGKTSWGMNSYWSLGLRKLINGRLQSIFMKSPMPVWPLLFVVQVWMVGANGLGQWALKSVALMKVSNKSQLECIFLRFLLIWLPVTPNDGEATI